MADSRSPALHRAVTFVALANLGYFGVEFGVARAIGSVSLFADSIDFLEDAAINEAARHLLVRRHSKLFWLVRCALARPIYALLLMAGIHPGSATMMLNYGGRGGFVRYLRKRTGANEGPGSP